MKNSRIMAMACFVALTMLGQGRAATLNPEDKLYQQIHELRDKWIEAEEAKDVKFMEQLFADDCVIGNSQGKVLDKAGFLESVRNPDRTIKVMNPRDIQARTYGNTAVWAERITVEGVEKGKPFGGEFRFVRIFVKQNGKWQVVLAQGTRLPSPSPEAK